MGYSEQDAPAGEERGEEIEQASDLNTTTPASRGTAFLLLALATLFWAGNWVLGRALRETFEPNALNLWRWLIAALVLAPFAVPRLRGQWPAIRRSRGLLVLLAFLGVAVF